MDRPEFRARLKEAHLSVRWFAATVGVPYHIALRWGASQSGRPKPCPNWVPLALKVVEATAARKLANPSKAEHKRADGAGRRKAAR